jgi:Co/Zn/Cd efflux system component
VAGIVTLEHAPTLHIVSIFIAFVALAASMFIAFRQETFGWFRWFSLAALLFALMALSFGNIGVLEAGTAQRMTALGILGWMSVAGIYFVWIPLPDRNDSNAT